jgi:uncharacterized protein (TIGR03067 family)
VEVFMRYLSVLAVSVILSQLSVTAADDNQEKGLKQLRGSWEVVKSEPKFEPKRLQFDGNKMTAVFADESKKETTIEVDSKAKPAQIDIIRDKEKSLGIYEVSDDTLRLCFSVNGDKRPTEFKANEGVFLLTLKRK